jgi:predicted RNase H-like HicB family nuclease
VTSTLSIPVEITAVVHEIEGGGYWAEVPGFPGCVAQAETLEALRDNIRTAIDDWLAGSPVKTEAEAEQLAAIQGSGGPVDPSFPVPYDYRPPASWAESVE